MARSSEAERKVRQLLQLLTCQTLRSEAWYQQQALWSHEDAVQTSQLQVPQSISEASIYTKRILPSSGILSAIYSEQSNFINFACLSVYLILKIKLIQFSQFKETQKLVSQISTLNYESV